MSDAAKSIRFLDLLLLAAYTIESFIKEVVMIQKLVKSILPAILTTLLLVTIGLKLHSLLSPEPVSNWNYHSLQKINPKQTDFSFVVFGDNKNSITVFRHLIDKINRENAAFAIDIGDLVFDGEMEKYNFFLKQAKLFKTPLMTAIGNHEIREDGRTPYYNIFGRYYYSFRVGNAYFIILDDANEKNIDPWQMQWLRTELEKSQSSKYRFVFMHVPLYDPQPNTSHCLSDTNNAAKLNRLFDHYKITMLFSSHIHAYFHGKWGQTPYIITGGAGAELAGKDTSHYFFHYPESVKNYTKLSNSDRIIQSKPRRLRSSDSLGGNLP